MECKGFKLYSLSPSHHYSYREGTWSLSSILSIGDQSHMILRPCNERLGTVFVVWGSWRWVMWQNSWSEGVGLDILCMAVVIRSPWYKGSNSRRRSLIVSRWMIEWNSKLRYMGMDNFMWYYLHVHESCSAWLSKTHQVIKVTNENMSLLPTEECRQSSPHNEE